MPLSSNQFIIAFNLSYSSGVISPLASLLFRTSIGTDCHTVAAGCAGAGITTDTGTMVAGVGVAATVLA